MRRTAIKLCVLIGLVFPIGFFGFDYAHSTARADAAGGSAIVDAGAADALPEVSSTTATVTTETTATDPGNGSGSSTATTVTTKTETTTKPADSIPDPLESPAQALDKARTAKQAGWGVFVLVVLIMLCRLLGKLGGVFTPLGKGKIAVVIAGLGTLAVTVYNALILEGSWLAACLAGAITLSALWNAEAKPAAAKPAES